MADTWLSTRCNPKLREMLIPMVRGGRLHDYRLKAGGDVEYGVWLYVLDQHLERSYGIRHDHPALAGYDWRAAHDAGDHPKDAGEAALDADDDTRAGLGEAALNRT